MLWGTPPRPRKSLVPVAKALHTRPLIASQLSAHTVPDSSMARTNVGLILLLLLIKGQSGPRNSGHR